MSPLTVHVAYRLTNGAEYLFTARDEPEVLSWVGAINSAIDGASGDNPPFEMTTPLPPPVQGDPSAETNARSQPPISCEN
jgi:hypothetical protein